jgi:spermidine synthase
VALYGGVFLLAAGTLLFEITLTRIFSIAQWYHFAFMAVGLGMLGAAASGSLLHLLRSGLVSKPAAGSPPRRSACAAHAPLCCALLFSVSVLGSYAACNLLPFDSFRLAWERSQLFLLAGYFLGLALPFLWSGLAFALLLARAPERSGSLYFANLSGSAAGALMTLAVLSLTSSEGGAVGAALLGLLAALAFASERGHSVGPLRTALLAPLVVLIVVQIQPRPLLTVRMSPYKPLSQILRVPDAVLEGTWWATSSRVDIVSSSSICSVPGLSLDYAEPMPPQKGLLTDGDNLQPLTQVAHTQAAFADYVPAALAYRLVQRPRVLILRPGGGMDVLSALHHGASRVVVAEPNALVLRLLRGPYSDAIRGLYQHPNVEIHAAQGRSYMKRTAQRFDLVQFSLSDGYRAASWGAFSLSEDYLYTVESMADAYELLTPQGFLVLSRWLQLPPSEETRAWSLAVAALEQTGITRPRDHLLALRSFQTVLILAKKTPLTKEDIATARQFGEELHLDLAYLPGIRLQEVNRVNVLPQPEYYSAFVAIMDSESRLRYYSGNPFDVRPTTDDRPFFFHYFRLSQVPGTLASLGKVWQPFGGGGYLVQLALLALVVLASALLVVLPLVLRPPPKRPKTITQLPVHTLVYFSFIGLAYLMVEIPLLQSFILLFDQPTSAFALVLFGLLFASAMGSLLLERARGIGLMWLIGPTVLACALLLRQLPSLLLAWPLHWRIVASIPLLSLVGILMGLPFPTGIRVLGRIAPEMIPWAWAVNGCSSVVGSTLAAMLVVSFGFSWVMMLAAGLYVLAVLALNGLMKHSQPAQSGPEL